eukprot:CAMPEP_0195254882 /NCGR_PEP_ID=MMETSP0706-20130129/5315_1 /TAXON_ID=33640 /ORGANISM="Asterionellopsis glacialis, Strain CCMP134" /LENGTH=47 /DNA_ID= /DNA_START= /DNA_END= /DNA_ORIENTATION=
MSELELESELEFEPESEPEVPEYYYQNPSQIQSKMRPRHERYNYFHT